jgi:hypothetical protein
MRVDLPHPEKSLNGTDPGMMPNMQKNNGWAHPRTSYPTHLWFMCGLRCNVLWLGNDEVSLWRSGACLYSFPRRKSNSEVAAAWCDSHSSMAERTNGGIELPWQVPIELKWQAASTPSTAGGHMEGGVSAKAPQHLRQVALTTEELDKSSVESEPWGKAVFCQDQKQTQWR